jgi:2-isopropylmalate synthase
MIPNPQGKYRAFPPIDLPDRTWPARTIDHPPVWLSTDLRDGNQALFEPMNLRRKFRLFDELVRIGFREIEIGFPAASQIDFDVARTLIREEKIPPDVTPMVMTQARADLIERTFEAVRGARRAIVHVYNATAPAWRKIVFGMSVPQVLDLIERHVALCRRLADRHPETEWVLQYSPETFCMTELDVSLEACNTAIRAWGADRDKPIIINLPTTVEVATPNIFADQIEWMHRRLDRREHVVLSVHPHNDRGTGVACAELALMAGAQRVEGCLFGNGERSGNVDLVTLALNLYTQGVHPGLDFSDIAAVARVAEECTALPIHPRHPYAGDLVFTAFSGSHQDAIKKGFAAQGEGAAWEVPYLPIDPKDLGRSYESVIRVNSQSGKGGISYLLERDHGVVMPRRMQVEFSAVVQRQADASEAEITSGALWDLFERTYLSPGRSGERMTYLGHRMLAGQETEGGSGQDVELTVEQEGEIRCLRGTGNGPIDAAVRALGVDMRVDHYEERSIGAGSGAQAWAIVEAAAPGVPGSRFGVGRHENIVTASILAVLSAAARLGVLARGAKPATRTAEQPT